MPGLASLILEEGHQTKTKTKTNTKTKTKTRTKTKTKTKTGSASVTWRDPLRRDPHNFFDFLKILRADFPERTS